MALPEIGSVVRVLLRIPGEQRSGLDSAVGECPPSSLPLGADRRTVRRVEGSWRRIWPGVDPRVVARRSQVVEQDAALRRVLARHHLLNRTDAGGVVGVADDVIGLHATSPATPYLSLHERIRGPFTDLDDALYERRSLVRFKAMRGTVFLVSRRLAPVIFAATRAATLASDRRWLATNDEVYACLAPKVLAALAGQALTRRRAAPDDRRRRRARRGRRHAVRRGTDRAGPAFGQPQQQYLSVPPLGGTRFPT